jgi:hypothetical protein
MAKHCTPASIEQNRIAMLPSELDLRDLRQNVGHVILMHGQFVCAGAILDAQFVVKPVSSWRWLAGRRCGEQLMQRRALRRGERGFIALTHGTPPAEAAMALYADAHGDYAEGSGTFTSAQA